MIVTKFNDIFGRKPTPAELEPLLKNNSPAEWEKLKDKLLPKKVIVSEPIETIENVEAIEQINQPTIDANPIENIENKVVIVEQSAVLDNNET